MKELVKNNELLAVAGCGNRRDKPNDMEEPTKNDIYEQVNLVSQHAYSFLFVIELKQHNEYFRLIQLKNS
jgi:hypothetical protein